MKREQRSRTAEAATAFRAIHLYNKPTIFEDRFAIQLTSPAWRIICKSRILRWSIRRRFSGPLASLVGQILARSRYAEDQLEKALADGVDQYVLVGAGLDSFALRRQDLATTLKIYELDHPASQDSKLARFAQLKIALPENVEFIPVDLERESLAHTLAKSSYSPERRAFFSWLGTTPYLTHDAVLGVLGSIASFAAPGSEIVFDYIIAKELFSSSGLLAVEKIERAVARRGEPIIGRFNPRVFLNEVRALGFELLENLSPAEQKARYFSGRGDGLRPALTSYFAHFRLRARSPA